MSTLQAEARRVVDDLVANGADPQHRPETAEATAKGGADAS